MSFRKTGNWTPSSSLSPCVLRGALLPASGWWGHRQYVTRGRISDFGDTETPYPKYSMSSDGKRNPISKTTPINNQTKSLPCLKWSIHWSPSPSESAPCLYFSHHCSQHTHVSSRLIPRRSQNMPHSITTPRFCRGYCLSQEFL